MPHRQDAACAGKFVQRLQLWNADRLGAKWMSLDLQARSCLRLGVAADRGGEGCFGTT